MNTRAPICKFSICTTESQGPNTYYFTLVVVFVGWVVLNVCGHTASASDATDNGTASPEPVVSGRIAMGGIAAPRHSGSASYQTFPVPLASVQFGDFAYIDYWQAGLYVLANEEKTLGIAIIATPRLGFSAGDGELLSGMTTRRTSLESGLSVDYGSDIGGISLGYLHDVSGATNGEVLRLVIFRRFEITKRLGVETFVEAERLSSRVANYYYGISNAEATPARPYYDPRNAFDETLSLHFNYDIGEKGTILFGCELTRLGSASANSPIVERRLDRLIYLGYGWRL